ncbi:tRNA pseudouridine(55) synthase TruB [Lusitaniella coriacea]|uniref:tRNA pseudouridine(55) synthase TruB n=1 Tax=Lusitaniella coriacea TaxID=1983105 RepID=UPI003CF53E0C
MNPSLFGFLNLNKPAGWTSHDCVAKVRRLLKIKKVGHGGTLDPLAIGVLPIAVGKATRLLQFLPDEKVYQARIRFGVQTTTDDLEGEIIETQSVDGLTFDRVQSPLEQFVGKIEQIPPAYSAIQQDGKRLYKLARAGKVVEVPPRCVEVHRIEVLAWHPGEFPELEVAIACGGGTYIRAIARDWGAALNIGGTLASLTRTHSCSLDLSGSLTLEQLATQTDTFQPIQPDVPLAHLAAIALPGKDATRWCQGQRISCENPIPTSSDFLRIYRDGGQFLGISEFIQSEKILELVPKVVLVP